MFSYNYIINTTQYIHFYSKPLQSYKNRTPTVFLIIILCKERHGRVLKQTCIEYVNLVQLLRYCKIILKYKDVGLNLLMFSVFMVCTSLIHNFPNNTDSIIHAVKTSQTCSWPPYLLYLSFKSKEWLKCPCTAKTCLCCFIVFAFSTILTYFAQLRN